MASKSTGQDTCRFTGSLAIWIARWDNTSCDKEDWSSSSADSHLLIFRKNTIQIVHTKRVIPIDNPYVLQNCLSIFQYKQGFLNRFTTNLKPSTCKKCSFDSNFHSSGQDSNSVLIPPPPPALPFPRLVNRSPSLRRTLVKKATHACRRRATSVCTELDEHM